MKNRLFTLIAMLFVACQFAQAQEDYARKVVSVLASDNYAGRGYVFNGDKKAAGYIAKEMKKSGLTPVDGKSFMQYFSLGANVFPKAATVKLNNEELKMGVNVLVDAASPSINGSFELVPVSGKLNDDNVLRQIAQDKAYAGKAIYIDEAEQLKTINAQELRRAIMLLMTAGEYRAIVVNTPSKFTWRASVSQSLKPAVYIKDLAINPNDSQISLDITAKYQPDYKTQNVCGFLKGSSDSDSTILVTAHYDHLGVIGKKVVFNGANDNASGTALMLYLAQYYGKNKPKYNMIFLAFSGEESGLLGSKYYAANPLNDLKKVKFLINVDMAGTGDDGIQVVNGSIFTKEFDLLTKLNAEKKYLPEVKVRGAMNRSDHAPFYEKGVPAFFIYTLGGTTAYHDIYDRYETLPFTRFNGYANLLTDFIDQF